jgi:hypothetical protein
MINVAVAWWLAGRDKWAWSGGAAIRYLARGGFHGFGPDEPVVVKAYVKRRPGGVRVVINTWQADRPSYARKELEAGAMILQDWIKPESASQFGDVSWDQIMFVDGFGLPFPSMSCAWKDEKTVVDGILLAPQTVTAAAPAVGVPLATSQGWNSTFIDDAESWNTALIDAESDASDETKSWAQWDTQVVTLDPSAVQQAPGGAVLPASWFAAPAVVSPPRALPLRPIWRGFALNTGIYSVVAALVWMLFVAIPSWMRRVVRVWRRRCAACGYPTGTSNVCTECGKAVSVRAMRSGA